MTHINIVRRLLLALMVCAAVLTGTATPGIATQEIGRATLTTAPGVMASLARADADMRANRPAMRRLINRAQGLRATFTFPVEKSSPMITLGGALVLTGENRSITLQDIRIDLRSRKVYVRVRELFNQSVHAFDLVGDIRTQTRPGNSGTRVTVRGATLVVSQEVGNLVNDALGLRGANAVFGAGAVIGDARLSFREAPRA
jgi:hypothetical protein